MKILLNIIVLIFFAYLSSFAQDARKDFNEINKMYNNTDKLAFDIKYELFFDNSKTPYQVETGKYIKEKANYYTKQAQRELIVTDELYIMVDKETKIVALDKQPEQFKIVNPLSLNLDSLYLLYSKIEVLPSSNSNLKGYKFYIKEGPYSACEVMFNSKTNFVTEIKNIFRETLADENNKEHHSVLKTTFTQIAYSPEVNKVFDVNKYFSKVNRKYVLTPLYKSFKFINHLN